MPVGLRQIIGNALGCFQEEKDVAWRGALQTAVLGNPGSIAGCTPCQFGQHGTLEFCNRSRDSRLKIREAG